MYIKTKDNDKYELTMKRAKEYKTEDFDDGYPLARMTKVMAEQQDEAIIDTVFLIQSGFFKTYDEYVEWYNKQEETKKIVAKYNSGYITNYTFQGQPITAKLDKHVFDYIINKYGRFKR